MALAVGNNYKEFYTVPSGSDFVAMFDFDFKVYQVVEDCYDVRHCCWLFNFVQICFEHHSN